MPAHHYHFVSYWRVSGAVDEAYKVLSDPAGYPRWWSEVFLASNTVAQGDIQGVGAAVKLLTRGRLPYHLRWTARVVEATPPFGVSIETSGDCSGRGIWSLIQEGSKVEIAFDWRVRSERVLLQRFFWLLKPLFSWSHRWTMDRGQLALRRELFRRREVKNARRLFSAS
jgi:hypothetical protein